MESISKQSQRTEPVSSARNTLLLVDPKKLALRASEVARVAKGRRILTQKLIGIGKPYEKLLLEILKLDPNGNEKFPTDKAMMKDLGVKINFYRKWMYQIYADLVEMLEDEENPKLEINKIEHHISCYERSMHFFFITTLPETSRVGSSFYVNFFRPIYKFNHFYVDSVTYRVLDGKMVVDIRIRTDFLNGYVKFKEDQEGYEAWQRDIGIGGSGRK